MKKVDGQVTPSFGPPQSRVQIFSFDITFFEKAVTRRMTKDFFNLISGDMVLPQKFINDVSKPDDAIDLHPQSSMRCCCGSSQTTKRVRQACLITSDKELKHAKRMQRSY